MLFSKFQFLATTVVLLALTQLLTAQRLNDTRIIVNSVNISRQIPEIGEQDGTDIYELPSGYFEENRFPGFKAGDIGEQESTRYQDSQSVMDSGMEFGSYASGNRIQEGNPAEIASNGANGANGVVDGAAGDAIDAGTNFLGGVDNTDGNVVDTGNIVVGGAPEAVSNPVGDAGANLVGGVPDAAASPVGGAVDAGTNLVGGVANTNGDVVDTGAKMVGGVPDAASNPVGNAVNIGARAIGGIPVAAASNPVEAGANLVGGVPDPANIIGAGTKAFGDAAGAAINTAGGFVNAGTNIAEGVAGAAANTAGIGAKVIGDVAGAAANIFGSFFNRPTHLGGRHGGSNVNNEETIDNNSGSGSENFNINSPHHVHHRILPVSQNESSIPNEVAGPAAQAFGRFFNRPNHFGGRYAGNHVNNNNVGSESENFNINNPSAEAFGRFLNRPTHWGGRFAGSPVNNEKTIDNNGGSESDNLNINRPNHFGGRYAVSTVNSDRKIDNNSGSESEKFYINSPQYTQQRTINISQNKSSASDKFGSHQIAFDQNVSNSLGSGNEQYFNAGFNDHAKQSGSESSQSFQSNQSNNNSNENVSLKQNKSSFSSDRKVSGHMTKFSQNLVEDTPIVHQFGNSSGEVEPINNGIKTETKTVTTYQSNV